MSDGRAKRGEIERARVAIPVTAPAKDEDEDEDADGFAEGIVRLLNQACAKHGLPPLVE